jgi:hypothetical protein
MILGGHGLIDQWLQGRIVPIDVETNSNMKTPSWHNALFRMDGECLSQYFFQYNC